MSTIATARQSRNQESEGRAPQVPFFYLHSALALTGKVRDLRSASFRKFTREDKTLRDSSPTRVGNRGLHAFTLIEMLVVLAVIGILVGLSLPNLRGLSEGKAMAAATRQLLDDVALARQRAISMRTTVAIIFVESSIYYVTPDTPQEARALTNLHDGPFRQYALFSYRTVGDQPGRGTPRYLSEWKTLPEKTMFAPHVFDPTRYDRLPDIAKFPFPLSSSANRAFPYIAFNQEGQLVQINPNSSSPWATLPYQVNVSIPLARGIVEYERSGGAISSATPIEIPPNNSIIASNQVRIDWLTGRARLERAEVK